MKFTKKRSIALILSMALALGGFAGCGTQPQSETPTPAPTATPNTQATQPPTTAPTPEEAKEIDISKPLELNMSVFYNDTVYMTYTVDGGNNRPQSEYVAANGKTYREGDFKPVWEELQKRLNFTINDVTPTSAKDVRASFTALQAQGFSGVDVMIGNALDIVQEGVINGTYVALDEYLDLMPNFKKFLDDNSVVKTAITAGDGHIYYAPYFDGYNDIERMLIARIDWVQKLLDNDDVEYDTDREISVHYTPYMPESLKTDITVVKSDGSGVQTITKEYEKNVITAQNELDKLNGENLVQVLKDHIDSTYPGVFENRSDLFVGQDAAYDADEFVALMRCVLANTKLLTGQDKYDAVPFFPRSYQAGRIIDLIRLAQIWGVRGLDTRLGYLYLNEYGILMDGRTDEAMMHGIERLNMLYKEGLILQDFDKDESTSGLQGSDHRERLLRANLGFATYDYNQTSTVYNSFADESSSNYIEGFFFTPILPPVAEWKNDGTYYQYTESWRSVKTDGWAILSTLKNDEDKLHRALKLFDYQYSPEGNRLMSYGPEDWIDGEISYKGEMVPKLSDAALNELATLAGGNYTNYYRMWLGATFPIGYVKEQGMEFQTVHEKGRVGLEHILKAVELGTMKHLVMSENDAEDPSFLTIPTTFATTQAEELFLKDNCTELANLFRQGNNNTDRILFTDYILYGFEGTTANNDKLYDKEGLIKYLADDLNGNGYIQVYREAYNRMVK